MRAISTGAFFALLVCIELSSVTRTGAATERHFTYTYESDVLSPGHLELEPWTTWRYGRERYYSRFDQRLEFELGVVPNLQAALYWNLSAKAQDVDDGAGGLVREQETEFSGISNEWKYKLSDSLADPLGSALYFEWSAGPAEAELEGKLILDKRLGDALVAFNAIAEHEWEFPKKGETERELELAGHLGVGWFVTPSFLAGAELRAIAELKGGEYEGTTFFAGPTVAFARESWWTALTFQPQLFFLEGEEEEGGEAGEGRLNLEDHERMELRLLLGLSL